MAYTCTFPGMVHSFSKGMPTLPPTVDSVHLPKRHGPWICEYAYNQRPNTFYKGKAYPIKETYHMSYTFPEGMAGIVIYKLTMCHTPFQKAWPTLSYINLPCAIHLSRRHGRHCHYKLTICHTPFQKAWPALSYVNLPCAIHISRRHGRHCHI